MEKQIDWKMSDFKGLPSIRKQFELAKLWDGTRLLMHKKQFPDQPYGRIQRFRRLAERAPPKGKILIAAAGTGNPELIGMGDLPKPLIERLEFSDGSPAMVELFERNYPAFKEKILLRHWEDLPETYGKRKLGAVFITGGSLGYVISWGEEKVREWAIDELRIAFEAVNKTLIRNGQFFFDLPKYTNENGTIGSGLYEGKRVEYSYGVTENEGIRTWTVSVAGEISNSATVQGISLDLGVLNGILAETGFKEATGIPESLQLDPLYYELHYAEKKGKFWQIF